MFLFLITTNTPTRRASLASRFPPAKIGIFAFVKTLLARLALITPSGSRSKAAPYNNKIRKYLVRGDLADPKICIGVPGVGDMPGARPAETPPQKLGGNLRAQAPGPQVPVVGRKGADPIGGINDPPLSPVFPYL